MDKLKTYLVVWLSGVIAGLIMVERWRRAGARVVPATERAEAVTETVASTTSDTPSLSASIIAGMKNDVQRARRVLDNVMPWHSASDASVTELRRWSRVTPPDNTVN